MGEQNPLLSKIALGLGIAGLLIGLVGVVIGIMGNNKRAELEAQTAYLYQEQQNIQKLQAKEHAADVFGRFFIPNYYSGNKEALNPFLSSGDAKYTQPEQAQVISNLLESVKLEKDGSFTLTYVITFSTAEGVNKIKRLSFGIKEDSKAEYGFLITSEPVSTSVRKKLMKKIQRSSRKKAIKNLKQKAAQINPSRLNPAKPLPKKGSDMSGYALRKPSRPI